MQIKIATIEDAGDLCDLNILFGNGASLESMAESFAQNAF